MVWYSLRDHEYINYGPDTYGYNYYCPYCNIEYHGIDYCKRCRRNNLIIVAVGLVGLAIVIIGMISIVAAI